MCGVAVVTSKSRSLDFEEKMPVLKKHRKFFIKPTWESAALVKSETHELIN